jgi:hypothetical protein
VHDTHAADRRIHERYSAWLPADLAEMESDRRVPATVVNISAGGALVRLGPEAPPGNSLAIAISWSGQRIELGARVVGREAWREGTALRLSFTGGAQRSQAALSILLTHLARQASVALHPHRRHQVQGAKSFRV